MLCLCAALLKSDFRLTSDAKIQPAITLYSCFWLFSPWSCVGHALRPIVMLWLVKIWQVISFGKFMQHLETCFLWQLKLTEFCVICEVFNCRFPSGCTRWNTAGIKSLLLFMARLLFSFSLRKSSLVKVGNPISYRFRLSPCLVKDQRVEKSQAILALLDSFQELHLEW